MGDISERYKNYSIDDLKTVIRSVDKEQRPDLFNKARIELEYKIKGRKDTGSFIYKNGTELFLDSYIDEKLSDLSFDTDTITIKNKISNSYFYLIFPSFISLLLIIATILGKVDYYFLVAYIIIVGSYFLWRILNEIYQYSRITKINFKTKTVHISISKKNNSKLKILFNLSEGDYPFDTIEGFFWNSTRNIIYEPTSWIFIIRIKFLDGTATPLCFSSTKYFTEKFSTYLNNIFIKK